MNRTRRVRVVVGLLALGGLSAMVALRTERAGNAVCAQLREKLPAVLDAEVSLGRCELDPLSLSVEVHAVTVEPHGAGPRVSAERAVVSLRGLYLGGIALQEVWLVRPVLELTLPPPSPADAAPAPKVETCPLAPLKRLRVASLRIDDARLTLVSGARSVKLDGFSVKASLGRRDGELTVDARAGFVQLEPGRALRLGRLSLEGALDLGDEALELTRAEVNVEGVSVALSGRLEALCERAPMVTATGQLFVPVAALPRFGLPLPGASGQVWTRVALSGRVDSPQVRADLQATQVQIAQFSPGDFSARVIYDDQKVVIEDFFTRAGEGEVHLSGEVGLGPGLPVKAKIDTRDASFGHIISRAGVPVTWVEFPATVKGAVSGTLSPFPSLGGDIEFHTGAFRLATRSYDAPKTKDSLDILAFAQSAGTFRFGLTKDGVAFDDVALTVGPAGHTRARGVVHLNPFDMTRFLDISAAFDQVDLSDFGAIAELPWAGVGTLKGTIKGGTAPGGTVVSPVIDGALALRDFKLDGYSLGVLQSPLHFDHDTLTFPTVVAQKGQTQYFGEVGLDFLEAGLRVRSTVQLPEGRLEDVVDLLADLSPTIQGLQGGTLVGRVSALAAVDSPAKELGGVLAFHLREVEFLDRRLGEAELITRFDHGEALVLEPTSFRGPLGDSRAAGRWAFAGPLDFQLSSLGPVAELVDPKGADELPVGGTFTFQAQVGGDTDHLLVDGSLDSTGAVTWKGRSLGPTHLLGKVVGRDFRGTGSVFDGLTLDLRMRVGDEWPYSAVLGVKLDDLSPFLPASPGSQLGGRAVGVVNAVGPMRSWRSSQGTALLDQLSLSRGDISAANTSPVEIGYDDGAFQFRSFSLKGPTTELTAAGSWGPSKVDLTSRGSVDLRLLSSVVSSVERSSGRLDFTAAFTGSVKSPSLAGSAELTDGRFALHGYDLQVRALAGRADFSESRVLLQDVQGFLNDGRLRGRGDLRLERFALKTAEVQVDLEDVTTQVMADVPATFSGSLLASTRAKGQWLVQGGLDVTRFRYTQPLQLESLLAQAKRGAPSDEKPEEWLKFDVDVALAGDARVDNNLARARLLGKVKLAGTNVKPSLLGAIEVGEGAQAFFRGNTYSVGRGLLQFNGLIPTFDLSAQSQVREYLVSVKAFGRLDDPKISLSSEPALSDADILSLITLGFTSRERLSSQSGAGLAAEALMSASGLDQQVQRFLSQNVGLKDQQVRLNTSFNESTGTVEPAVSWESKVGVDNLKVGVLQPVTGRGTKAQAEYRINQQVSARAQWDNQNQTTPIGNPGVDLRFRFEWE